MTAFFLFLFSAILPWRRHFLVLKPEPCHSLIPLLVPGIFEDAAAAMRTFLLAQPLILLLKEWKLRTKRKKPEELVFPNKRGWYTSHDNMIKRKFLPLFDLLAANHRQDPTQHPEPPARFNWRALRHFAVSCWIEAGLNPKTVQTFAGHSSLQVTMDRYGHLFKSDDQKKAMDVIAKNIFTSIT
jgi:integrase